MASGSVFLPAQERRQMRNPISIEQERTLSSTSFAEGAAYPESELWRYTAGGWEKASWLTAETHCVPSTKNPRVHPAYLGGFLMLMMIGFRCLPVCKSD
jgi:hypothetical protein